MTQITPTFLVISAVVGLIFWIFIIWILFKLVKKIFRLPKKVLLIIVGAIILLIGLSSGPLLIESYQNQQMVKSFKEVQVASAQAYEAKLAGDDIIAGRKVDKSDSTEVVKKKAEEASSKLNQLKVPKALGNYKIVIKVWTDQIVKAAHNPEIEWKNIPAEPAEFTTELTEAQLVAVLDATYENFSETKAAGDLAISQNNRVSMRALAGQIGVQSNFLSSLTKQKKDPCKGWKKASCQKLVPIIQGVYRSALGVAYGQVNGKVEWDKNWGQFYASQTSSSTQSGASQEVPPIQGGGEPMVGAGITKGEPGIPSGTSSWDGAYQIPQVTTTCTITDDAGTHQETYQEPAETVTVRNNKVVANSGYPIISASLIDASGKTQVVYRAADGSSIYDNLVFSKGGSGEVLLNTNYTTPPDCSGTSSGRRVSQ